MASTSNRRQRESGKRPGLPPKPTPDAPPQFVTARPGWILAALSLILAVSFVCGYLTLCVLFYQGQWQLVLQPAKAVYATPATVGLPFQDVRFDDTEAGQPQLAGWYLPAGAETASPAAAARARYADVTVLYLRDGRGSLSDSLQRLKLLHGAGVNVFAFDYRGFGQSASAKPSEQLMLDDADAAWTYLTETRMISPGRIVLYGERLGAMVAAEAAIRHPRAAAVVMMSPFASMLPRVLADPRSDLVPVRMLFHNRFDLAARIAMIKQPKLIGFTGGELCVQQGSRASTMPCPVPAEAERLFKAASYPKEMFNDTDAAVPQSAFIEFLSRFLDEYLPPYAVGQH